MLLASARIFQEIFRRVLKRAGFESGYITFHSLRHPSPRTTCSTAGTCTGFGRSSGHADVTITQRYAHLSPTAYKADHQRLGGVLSQEVDATVLPLTRSKR